MITLPSFPTHYLHLVTSVCDHSGMAWDTWAVKSVQDFDPRALRSVREGRGLSQGDVAKAIGVTSNTYGRWERGSAPSSRLFAALVSFFGVAPSAFLSPLADDADLATLRTRAGLRQEDVAEGLGVQASDVSELEQGTAGLRDDWAIRLHDLYDVPLVRVIAASRVTEDRWREAVEGRRTASS
ncbi:helix-turn-helix domain-containing protein [Streptomyces sp. NPDC056773]|uniref:helix-turn-helix domain-containing protein n=1 Tax=unclassified Streptomyces TaxID=2593676 RepID=UPI003683EA5D